jgi:hypothetical protein
MPGLDDVGEGRRANAPLDLGELLDLFAVPDVFFFTAKNILRTQNEQHQ